MEAIRIMEKKELCKASLSDLKGKVKGLIATIEDDIIIHTKDFIIDLEGNELDLLVSHKKKYINE